MTLKFMSTCARVCQLYKENALDIIDLNTLILTLENHTAHQRPVTAYKSVVLPSKPG